MCYYTCCAVCHRCFLGPLHQHLHAGTAPLRPGRRLQLLRYRGGRADHRPRARGERATAPPFPFAGREARRRAGNRSPFLIRPYKLWQRLRRPPQSSHLAVQLVERRKHFDLTGGELDGAHGFREEPACEEALNVYAFSKLFFDNYLRRLLPTAQSQVVGLRYFNVYGPQENHKGKISAKEDAELKAAKTSVADTLDYYGIIYGNANLGL